MPSSNGVYSLPPGYLAVTGQPILVTQHNPIFEDIAQALTLRLSRDGTAPMTGPLQHTAGSAGFPSATFTTDPSSGLYKTTSGIGVAIGGVKVAEFTAGGMVGARFIGELIPFSGSTAPALTVFAFGQALSRTTYAALWTFAQTEIAAGNLSYNNGDGSTTFGIPDTRGRVLAGKDNAGGVAAGRLTIASILAGSATTATTGGTTTLTAASAGKQVFTGTLNQTVLLPVVSTLTLGNGFFFQNDSTGILTIQSSGGNTVEILGPGTTATVTCIAITGTTAVSWQPGGGVDGSTLGASGGGQTQTLALSQLPTGITSSLPSLSGATNLLNSNANVTASSTGGGGASIGVFPPGTVQSVVTPSITGTITSNNTGGAAHSIVPPAIVVNYILFAGA
jgi:microcystin-dependent protein